MRVSGLALSALALAAMLRLAGTAGAIEIGAYRGPGCDGRAAMAPFEALIGRKVERTVEAVRFLLSVIASTITATPFGP